MKYVLKILLKIHMVRKALTFVNASLGSVLGIIVCVMSLVTAF